MAKSKVKTEKEILENAKKLGLSDNSIKVIMKRNLWKNKEGEIIELPEDMFRRAAKVLSGVEKEFGTTKKEIRELEEKFFTMMSNQDFLSNRVLKNAGREFPFQQFAACYVFPIKDDLDFIFKILKRSAFIQKWDAACGIDYSVLRPRNDIVASTGGKSSGPISFMTLFNRVSEVISEGSLRRGANMGVLRVDHPDIEEFIHAKKEPGVLECFNVSVGITDKFMKAAENGEEYSLINPRTGKEAKKLDAKVILKQIIESAWESAEPGLIFLGEIARGNPTPHIGEMTAVNLCGEQPLLPWESCILGNIKLTNFVKDVGGKREIDWDKLREIIHLGIRFLDNAVEANNYSYKEIEDIVKNGNRKVGLGVMAYADLLFELSIAYDSEEGVDVGRKLMKFIRDEAEAASGELAKKRGNFPNYKGSKWDENGIKHIRNACLTTVAPTGSLSVIANCSSGIEPVFALAFTRYALGTDEENKEKMFFVNKKLEQTLKKEWLYSEERIKKIIDKGSIQKIDAIPDKIKEIFVTSMDIEPEWHIKMQAAFQESVDSAVSKTINMSKDATVEDVESAYLLAYKLKCKGITVYRDQSRQSQVLTIGDKSNKKDKK